MGKNISETNLIDYLKVLLEVEKSISLQNFIKRVGQAFNLTDDDKKKSATRPNEMMYEQRCRNLKSHNSFPDNILYENQTFKLK